MSSISRLEKAFLRSGIRIVRDGSVVFASRPDAAAKARILLPPDLPLEEKAVRQLLDFAAVRIPGVEKPVRMACATPDFHPGSGVPVGSIVATASDVVIPAAIGTDINCGMRLLDTGLTLEEAETGKDALIAGLSRALLHGERDVPMSARAFAALFDDGPATCLELLEREGLWTRVDHGRLIEETARCVGLSSMESAARYVPQALTVRKNSLIRDPSLGTTGAGNHFVELQVVDGILDRRAAWEHGIAPGRVMVMIHSGSRDLGFAVGRRWADRARESWPRHMPHPDSGLYGLAGTDAAEYLKAMGAAARYAWFNRVVLSEMVRDHMTAVFGKEDRSRLIVDVPHNVILREHGYNIHRKGATPAHEGDLALIPGSMGDYSYIATGSGNPDWLHSCSHGAGRSLRRRSARTKASGHPDSLPWQCVTLREERRREEAPIAYKKIGPVIDVQESSGLIRPLARLRPWITFKA